VVCGRKGQCGDCECVHLNSSPGSTEIGHPTPIEQEACPEPMLASWPQENQPPSVSIAHEIRVGEGLGRSRGWELFFPFGYSESPRSGCCGSRCAGGVPAGGGVKQGPSQTAGPSLWRFASDRLGARPRNGSCDAAKALAAGQRAARSATPEWNRATSQANPEDSPASGPSASCLCPRVASRSRCSP
jgi:hypothetical protein